MKIEYGDNKDTFNNLWPGDCFRGEYTVLMKIEAVQEADGDVRNCVDLSNGELEYMQGDEFVFPVEAKVVVP